MYASFLLPCLARVGDGDLTLGTVRYDLASTRVGSITPARCLAPGGANVAEVLAQRSRTSRDAGTHQPLRQRLRAGSPAIRTQDHERSSVKRSSLTLSSVKWRR